MFQNKKANVILSIIIAIVIWAYVFFEINPLQNETISSVPVKLTGVEKLNDRDLTIINEDEYTVDVKIKGQRSEIADITADDIEAVADVSSFTEGENDVRVKVTVPESVSKEDVKPSSITINVEEYVTAKKSVKIDYSGDFENNTEPGLVSVSPEQVEVTGAISQVKKVTSVRATIDSSEMGNEEQTIKTKLVPVDKEGEEVNGIKLSQRTADVSCTLLHLKTVPLEVPVKGKVNSNYEITGKKIPDTVRIKGVKSQIDKINKLKSKSINIDNIKKTTEIPIEIDLPSRVELSSASENLVAVIEVGGITASDISYDSSDIRIDNLEEGYSAQINESGVDVSVYGDEKVIAALKANDIELYLDMKDADYTKEIYIAEIKYKTTKKVENVTINPAKVHVKIIKD